MKNVPVIGLTGGIASGKSAISDILQQLGAEVINADHIARHVLDRGTDAYRQVIDHFGTPIIRTTGEIDRKALATIIFDDESERSVLNKIVHPIVISQIEARIAQLRSSDQPPVAIVVEVPLLFEVGMQLMFDQVWVVWVSAETQIKRLCARERLVVGAARQRIGSQMPLDQKKGMADAVIDNNGTLRDTFEQVNMLWRKITLER